MLVEVPKPSQTSIVFLDTSVLTRYLVGGIELRGVSGTLEKNMREFVLQFKQRGIVLRITPTIRSQLKYARDIIRRSAMENDVSPGAYAEFEAKMKKRLADLEQRLMEVASNVSLFVKVNEFYEAHKTKADLMTCRQKKEDKTPIPEESDRLILAEVANYPEAYFLVADCDFFTVDEEIAKTFRIFVLSQENMNRVMQKWGWI